MRSIEKQVLITTLDTKWREHLLRLEHLRAVVGFVLGYAQARSANEYKTEGFQLFENLLDSCAWMSHAEAGPGAADLAHEQAAMMAQMAEAQKRAPGRCPAPRAALAAPVTELAGGRGGRSVTPGTPRGGFVESDPSTWGNPGR